MKDYYIEDIECNGVGFPIYVVHRKYSNLRTSIIYGDSKGLADFVEKLAQRAGRYVSYARPLLDGTLPDGSRVNATYSEDVTTRGPTFTIRKFTKEPWTPIHLMKNNTAPSSSFAFLWMAIESKLNVMVIGETASGKTTFLNTILHFIPPEARICSIEDTRELNIAHSNWLPAVTREGFGIPNVVGKTYGEVTLFDLLKETFRQNPDYVVVGEVRGDEAYVLFQGMASGHPSFGTFHAGSVETLVRRLETPPINLSGTLIESLDVVCVCVHLKEQDKSIRRLKQLVEVIDVSPELGDVNSNNVFEWISASDEFSFDDDSYIFKKISERTGQAIEDLKSELDLRTRLLDALSEKNIVSHKDVSEIINFYYKNPEAVLERFNIK
jgi:flagellar protein FlaI